MCDDILNRFKSLYDELKQFEKSKIPLCAAENYLSPFVKQALSSLYEGKYRMGLKYDKDNDKYKDGDFIGSRYVLKLYELIEKLCKPIFKSCYADPRTLTGMNCDMLLFMSLAEKGDKFLLTTHEQGGHSSVPIILEKLGMQYDEMPYDYENYQIDYEKTNELLAKNDYKFITFCQSDLLQPPDLRKLDIPERTILLYDGTQTLGMIAARRFESPLERHEKAFLFGGTHKTLPGPSCGLILSNNRELANKIENKINPDFLRNTQANNVAGLLLSLIEQKECGEQYQQKIVETANILGKKLTERDIKVARLADGSYTRTHQLFILTDEELAERIYKNSIAYNVTLNKKHKRLFGDYGVRLGVQEIARYGWDEKDLEMLAELISLLAAKNADGKRIWEISDILTRKKTPYYKLEDYFMLTE